MTDSCFRLEIEILPEVDRFYCGLYLDILEELATKDSWSQRRCSRRDIRTKFKMKA